MLHLALALFAWEGFLPVGKCGEVQVYRHPIEIGIALGAEGPLDATPDRVQRVLTDYAHHLNWVQGLVESRVLKSGVNELYVYQRLDLPIVSDRDFTLHVRWGQLGDGRWLHFETANEVGPEPKRGIVRVPHHQGSWQLDAIDGKRTNALYRFELDLGGSVPQWALHAERAMKDICRLFESVRGQLKYYP
jgi:hypothetical protein